MIEGFSGQSAQNGAFSPEMEIALDHAGMDTSSTDAPCQPVETEAGVDRQGLTEPLATPVSGSPMSTLVALMQRVHAIIRLPIAGAGDERPDIVVPVSSDECKAEGISTSLTAQLAPNRPRTADDGTARLIEEDLSLASSAIALVATGPAVLPGESMPPPVLARLGLTAANESVPDATSSGGGSGAASEPLPGQRELPAWAVSGAAGQHGPVAGSPFHRLNILQTATVAAQSPRLHVRTEVESGAMPEPVMSALDGLPFEQAGDDGGGALVFEAALKPRGTSQASGNASATGAPISDKSQSTSARLRLSGMTGSIAMDPRPARPEQDSIEEQRHEGSPDLQSADSQEAGQSSPEAKAATGGGQPAASVGHGSAAANLADSRFSFDAPAGNQGEPSMPSGATSRASEPASAAPAAPVALDPDFEPGGAGNTVREVSFKLEGADGAAVHLKFTERRGEVHVVTRTQDAGLSRKLSGDLPELRKAIEDSGLSGDIWSAGQELTVSRESQSARADAGPNPGNQQGAWLQQDDAGGRRQGRHADRWADQIEDALDDGIGGRK